jgi:hypothetical protein
LNGVISGSQRPEMRGWVVMVLSSVDAGGGSPRIKRPRPSRRGPFDRYALLLNAGE